MAIFLPTPIIYGVSSGDLGDHIRDAPLSLTGNATVIGDANTLFSHAVGGDDTIVMFSISGNVVAIGDAVTMADQTRGGDDNITANANVFAAIVAGDAVTLSGHAHGGNDTITASGRSSVTLYGDAQVIEDHAQGGNDTVIVGASRFGLTGFGDAQIITDHGRGGDDVVSGQGFGSVPQQLYGDAYTLSGSAIGGNDTVIGANGGPSQIYGDGHELLDHAKGGDDVLVSGAANDLMWGDAPVVAPTAQTGADTFLFDRTSQPNLGNDTIEDFEPGKDQIALQHYSGVANFGDLTAHISDTAAGSLITFDAQNTILVANDHALAVGDFVFG
jgi:hypothetical protein